MLAKMPVNNREFDNAVATPVTAIEDAGALKPNADTLL